VEGHQLLAEVAVKNTIEKGGEGKRVSKVYGTQGAVEKKGQLGRGGSAHSMTHLLALVGGSRTGVEGHHILAEVAVKNTIEKGGEGKRVREVYRTQGAVDKKGQRVRGGERSMTYLLFSGRGRPRRRARPPSLSRGGGEHYYRRGWGGQAGQRGLQNSGRCEIL
jgi:hypothetical protein